MTPNDIEMSLYQNFNESRDLGEKLLDSRKKIKKSVLLDKRNLLIY